METKRKAILDAALGLISRRGFHAAPMSLLAREAGVGAGTIYRYFKSKDELIEELYKFAMLDLSRSILAAYSEDLAPKERFRRLWLKACRYCIENPKKIVFLEQYENSPYFRKSLEEEHYRYFQPVFDFFEHAIEEGIVKDLPMEMLLSLSWEVTVCLAKKHLTGKLALDERLTEAAMEACWDAIKR